MTPRAFLLANLALAFYDTGTIWAHEVDIFRSWPLVGAAEFHRVQRAHWRKLPYWVLAPVGLALAGALALPWLGPAGAPPWGPGGAIAAQGGSLLLTALLWGPSQARLARDPAGPRSPHLDRILATHWLRTLLVSANAAILLAWALRLEPR